MNYNQNKKLTQITPTTLIIGVDIAKHKHVARAQDDRGYQYGKPLTFENQIYGFQQLLRWVKDLGKEHQKTDILVGMEPTGHYWMNLAYYLRMREIPFVLVNPMHVKRTKELDDNSPTKNDVKDARVIAQLVKDGRYSIPRLPQGHDAELREGMKLYDQLDGDIGRVKNRLHNWLDRYFPEFFMVFKNLEGKTALATLEAFGLPQDILERSPEAILAEWRKTVQRGVGLRQARKLHQIAEQSIGLRVGSMMARHELATLMQTYRMLKEQQEQIMTEIERLMEAIPGVEKMLNIPGLSVRNLAGLYAEIGDFRYYDHPQQMIKLAGLNLRENTSGKHKGQTTITKRGRKGLRAKLYWMVMPLVATNEGFRKLHEYYTTRPYNALKKKQSLVVLCCKLIRVLFAMSRKQEEYSSEKLLRDIPHFSEQIQAA